MEEWDRRSLIQRSGNIDSHSDLKWAVIHQRETEMETRCTLLITNPNIACIRAFAYIHVSWCLKVYIPMHSFAHSSSETPTRNCSNSPDRFPFWDWTYRTGPLRSPPFLDDNQLSISLKGIVFWCGSTKYPLTIESAWLKSDCGHRRAYPSGVSATVMSWSPMTFRKYPGLCHFVNAGQYDNASILIRDVLDGGFNLCCQSA